MTYCLGILTRQAEEFDDFGLKVVLENQVADETRHKEEIERIIAGWDERCARPTRQGGNVDERSHAEIATH